MPTILELAKLEHPENYRGRNVERMRGRSLAGVTSGFEENTYVEDALIGGRGGMHFTPGYPISCGWLIRRPRTCCTISE